MRIINHTHWKTNQLKTILCRVAREEIPDKMKRVIVFIEYAQSHGWCTGLATIGDYRAIIRVQREIFNKGIIYLTSSSK